MAATPYQSPLPGATLFDIYNDNTLNAPGSAFALPGGACNFVDISPGINGARCGCRRFWIRQVPGSPLTDQSGWCMCNHHACYHEIGSNHAQGHPNGANVAGQENERPRTGREPLSPVLDIPLATPSAVPGMDFPIFGPEMSLSFVHDYAAGPPAVSGAPSLGRPASSMPDTLNWGDYGPSQGGLSSNNHNNTLPPIPSQCLLPSQTASTTSSVQAKYLRPFAGKGLQTLTSATSTERRSLLQAAQPRSSDLQTPPQGRASMEDSFVFVTPDLREHDTTRSGTATQAEPRTAVAAADANPEALFRETLKNLSDTVSGHEQRLDKLETSFLSAGGVGHDECSEKYDQLDLRAADLEHRMDEAEKQANDNDSVVSRQPDKNDDLSAQSVISIATSATSRPAYSQDVYSQIQTLQAQVTQLQSSVPSYKSPWKVEVVFLPFPMRRLWQDAHQFKDDPSIGSDDWTQLPMTNSTGTLRSQSPFFGDWEAQERDMEWLLPKACGDQSLADRRLRSRGLVKTVSVTGPDARSVHIAINAAFGSVFRNMQLVDQPQVSDPNLSGFLGLRSTWVPLRKIHKDSRLRFLSPAEMVTPAIWDVQFLNAVMMRSSEPRLFITHPDAYLQDVEAYDDGWSWHRLRALSRVYPDVSESQDVPEADALEECWAWTEQLDASPGVVRSVGSRQGSRRISASPDLLTAELSATTPMVGRGPSPMLAGRRGLRPPHIRTTSVPIASAGRSSPLISKRRVFSHGHSTRRSSPSVRMTTQWAVPSRRRTRSPSHPRLTPRWTASPSPVPLGLHERQPAQGTTPMAYATPFSNAPLQETLSLSGDGTAQNVAEDFVNDYQTRLDELYDIEIYETASDQDFEDVDDHESTGSVQVVTHAQPDHPNESPPNRQLPEDQPWPGIEDQDRMSDGENIDPQRDDVHSDISSQPSEYPTTQRAWPDNDAGFQIHEDEDGMAL